MKNMHYYIVTLVVLLFMVAPAKAASEAEFGKLHKTYILHTDEYTIRESSILETPDCKQ